DPAGVAKALWGMAAILYASDPPDWQRAIELLVEAKEKFRQLGDNFGLGWALYVLGACYTGVDNFAGARDMVREALAIFAGADDKSGVALALNQLAVLAVADGDPVRAARLEGARATLETASGVGLISSRRVIMPKYEDEVRRLPETQPDAYSAGRAMDLEEAIALALDGHG